MGAPSLGRAPDGDTALVELDMVHGSRQHLLRQGEWLDWLILGGGPAVAPAVRRPAAEGRTLLTGRQCGTALRVPTGLHGAPA